MNLAPADRRKEGTVYDLPMLVGLLQGSGQLEADLEPWGFVGEVALSGQLRPVRGMLSMALAARRAGMRGLFVPADSASEAILAGEITVYPVETLNSWWSTCPAGPRFPRRRGRSRWRRRKECPISPT